MKVVVINGSPRGAKSETLRLAKGVCQGAGERGAKVELIDACKLRIEYCKACDACHRTGRCVHRDDFDKLRETMLAADGIVFASPNYFRCVTAQLKTVIDRMADVIHCQRFAGKYACSISTSGGPACEEVTRYLDGVLQSFGATAVGSVAAAVGKGPEAMAEAEQKAIALGRELADAIASQRVYPEQRQQQAQTAAYFKRLVELNKDRWPFEYELWARTAR
jgi:multimeric flavodoxin WrbA